MKIFKLEKIDVFGSRTKILINQAAQNKYFFQFLILLEFVFQDCSMSYHNEKKFLSRISFLYQKFKNLI